MEKGEGFWVVKRGKGGIRGRGWVKGRDKSRKWGKGKGFGWGKGGRAKGGINELVMGGEGLGV